MRHINRAGDALATFRSLLPSECLWYLDDHPEIRYARADVIYIRVVGRAVFAAVELGHRSDPFILSTPHCH
jgi:hypothetical protein